MRKVAVVTGTRAEYGLLYWLMKEIQQEPEFELQIIVTGMHLSPEFGLTYRSIEEDGFTIDEKVEMLLSSDSNIGIAKSIGVGIIGFTDTLHRLQPDLLILLGDRYEILAAAQAALVAKIPMAHIAGGDSTEGAFDEAIRHSITKMSHLHFVTNEDALRRIKQLGENPNHIFNVGSPGLDWIKRLKLLDRAELEASLEFPFYSKNLLITFHPVTLSLKSPEKEFQELLTALNQLQDVGLIFTKPNSDPGSRGLIQMLDNYVADHPNAKSFTSLGQLRYLSLIAQVDAVVGNSSSGFYEVPSFNKPTVDIGERQQGRLRASSVIHCETKADLIYQAILRAFQTNCNETINPYGDGDASRKIIKILKQIGDYQILLKKHFHEV